MDGSTTYENDVILWSREQAAALRSGDLSRLDIEHLADEIEDVGKSEQRELESRMSSLLAHLIKWAFQPERRGSSWERTIRFQREGVNLRIKRTPSLKADLGDADWWRLAWNDAVVQAEKETGLENLFPEACPWTVEEVLAADWLPV
jgi:hypothetical protein